MDSFENNNEIIDAIQARENDLKNQQIQLGKEIKVSHRMSHDYDVIIMINFRLVKSTLIKSIPS